MPASTPALNWKELSQLVPRIAAEAEELFVEKIIVPERALFPSGYLKGEWVIRLQGRKRECNLLLSVRARHPYLALVPGKGPKAAAQGTRSPFDLALSKQLKGARIARIEALPRERVIVIDFAPTEPGAAPLSLAVSLIPATPEAFLVTRPPQGRDWPVLARSRAKADDAVTHFTPPDGSRAPDTLSVRQELTTLDGIHRAIEEGLEAEAFEQRSAAAARTLKDRIKQARDRVRVSETAIREAEKESDWQRFGDLLKSSIGMIPETPSERREVLDYATGETAMVPCDPKLTLRQQVERFYHLARRKQRRVSEARTRLESFGETLARLEALAGSPAAHGDWKALERLERELGVAAGAAPPAGKKGPKAGAWLGKSFLSKDGWTIWAGRSKDENLELTFRHARGNDLWMHVRGRPGAHVVIPVQPGKSVPLETLLDAAALTIHYSGGEKWGKTEVDYTFKKHVKRIKDSTEASYTHNKTLIVEPDAVRLKRLLHRD